MKRLAKRRGTEYAEKKSERQEGHDESCPYKRNEIGGARKVYGGKLKDLSLVSTQTLTTLVFWLFSGSAVAMGMGEKGLMATWISTLVAEPFGDLAFRML